MNLRYLLAIIALVTLAPLLILQALYLRRHALRLPPAQGQRSGSEPGAEPAVEILVLGESTAAGVGVSNHRDSLAGQVATALSQRLHRVIRWEVAGLNGLITERTAATLFPWVQAERADIVVLALGVNDTLALRNPRRWLRDLESLIIEVRSRFQPQLVVISAVPPVGKFIAIPQPLRFVFGLVAQSLDEVTQQACARRPELLYAVLPRSMQNNKHYLSSDGFHPSSEGYAAWGALLAEAIAARMRETAGPL